MENFRNIKIAPSILAADFSRLGEEVREVEELGADWIHVDVMDGHFVPNLTIGAPVVKALRKVTNLPLDVHLMIEEPLRYIEDFKRAGSDWLTIHVEGTPHVRETLEAIRSAGIRCGLSVKPKTKVTELEPYLGEVSLILIMTVEPGFGGQFFMPDMMEKVRWLRPRFRGLISVDGGINRETAMISKEAGADVLVAGTSVFGEPDRGKAIRILRGDG